MSMRSWTESGYGYELFTKDNYDNIKNFLLKHLELLGLKEEDIVRIRQCNNEELEIEDIIDEDPSWVIATLMNKIEDTNIFKGYMYCGDTNQEPMIGITPMYPWDIKRVWSKETADNILNKYAKELGIEGEPDYFEAEYFG